VSSAKRQFTTVNGARVPIARTIPCAGQPYAWVVCDQPTGRYGESAEWDEMTFLRPDYKSAFKFWTTVVHEQLENAGDEHHTKVSHADLDRHAHAVAELLVALKVKLPR